MILCFWVFFLFVFVLMVFRINVMLSLKPLFLSVSECTGINSLKATSLEEMPEIWLVFALGISLIIVWAWFNFLLMYTGILSGFPYLVFYIILFLYCTCVQIHFDIEEISSLKACVCYFLSIFYFSQNNSLSKTMKNVFYFI